MYDVVVLVEEELSVADAERLVELYGGTPERVRFDVVIPCEDAQAQVEASLAGMAGTELFGMAGPRYAPRADDEIHRAADDAQRAVDAAATAALERSVGRLRSLDREAEGIITRRPPVDELVDYIQRVHGQEVVILTRPHVIAELLHVDWSAQARRHLGVPVLHLLEQHQDNPTA
jgi:CBS domain-containing protein